MAMRDDSVATVVQTARLARVGATQVKMLRLVASSRKLVLAVATWRVCASLARARLTVVTSVLERWAWKQEAGMKWPTAQEEHVVQAPATAAQRRRHHTRTPHELKRWVARLSVGGRENVKTRRDTGS